MNDCDQCLISHYFSTDYFKGLAHAQPGMNEERQLEWGKDHGFDLPDEYAPYSDFQLTVAAWRYLEDLWMTELCKFS